MAYNQVADHNRRSPPVSIFRTFPGIKPISGTCAGITTGEAEEHSAQHDQQCEKQAARAQGAGSADITLTSFTPRSTFLPAEQHDRMAGGEGTTLRNSALP